jgi:hypothetical protein
MLGTYTKRHILLAALLGLTSGPALAADWRLTAARQTRFGGSLHFVDFQSIRGGDGQVQFSALTFFSRKTRHMNRVATMVTADCRAMTYRFDQIILFRNQQPLSTWRSTAPTTARPNSNVFDAIGAACGIAEPGAHIEAIEGYAANRFRKRPRRTFGRA